MKKLMMILVCALGLVACSSQYIMSTKDGKMITTESKRKMTSPKSWSVEIIFPGSGQPVGGPYCILGGVATVWHGSSAWRALRADTASVMV